MAHPSSDLSDDNILLQQIACGSRPAFNILFEKYWDKAYTEAYKRVKESEAAKDIVQEIFTHIWIKRETLHLESLPAYLHIAIRNKVIRYAGKQKLVHPFFNILDRVPGHGSEPDARLLWMEFFAAYEKLLASLPPQRQLIFRLRYQEDLPTKDISAQLRLSRKTVQNQLGRAIETLKGSLLRMLIPLLLWMSA